MEKITFEQMLEQTTDAWAPAYFNITEFEFQDGSLRPQFVKNGSDLWLLSICVEWDSKVIRFGYVRNTWWPQTERAKNGLESFYSFESLVAEDDFRHRFEPIEDMRSHHHELIHSKVHECLEILQSDQSDEFLKKIIDEKLQPELDA